VPCGQRGERKREREKRDDYCSYHDYCYQSIFILSLVINAAVVGCVRRDVDARETGRGKKRKTTARGRLHRVRAATPLSRARMYINARFSDTGVPVGEGAKKVIEC
jgi:hypothetical protein